MWAFLKSSFLAVSFFQRWPTTFPFHLVFLCLTKKSYFNHPKGNFLLILVSLCWQLHWKYIIDFMLPPLSTEKVPCFFTQVCRSLSPTVPTFSHSLCIADLTVVQLPIISHVLVSTFALLNSFAISSLLCFWSCDYLNILLPLVWPLKLVMIWPPLIAQALSQITSPYSEWLQSCDCQPFFYCS